MRLSWLLFFVGSLWNLGTGAAQPVQYATQGFTPPGGCGSSTAGSLNVIVSLPVPVGSNELEIRQVSYALRGTTSQPSTMKISANGYQVTANPQTGSTTCCSASSCDLASYTIGSLGQTWYESPCGKPTCGTAQQWYKLSFPSNSIFYNGVTSVSVNVDFNGGFMDLANFGSGSSFFISYYVYYPSPSPTPTPTRTSSITSSPTRTTSVTSSPSPSATPSPSISSTSTVTASITSSPSPSDLPSSTVSSSISGSPSVSVSPSPTVSSSISGSPSASSSPSASISPTSTVTFTPSPRPSPSATASPSATKSSLLVSSQPPMSDFGNSTAPMTSTSGSYDTATILSGTTVGITGLALMTYVINYLRRTGALNVLRSLGISIPLNTTAKTEEEKQAEAAGANTALGKAAALITKAKEEKKEILKVVDSLPLPEQLKYAAHNPKSLLSKSAQNKIQTVERDLEKALPPKQVLTESVEPPKLVPEAFQILQQCADQLGIKIPPQVLQMKEETEAAAAVSNQNEVIEEVDEDYTQALEESKQEVPVPAPPQTTKKTRATPGARATQAKKATIEVNEAELAEIKLILANKKKAFNVV